MEQSRLRIRGERPRYGINGDATDTRTPRLAGLERVFREAVSETVSAGVLIGSALWSYSTDPPLLWCCGQRPSRLASVQTFAPGVGAPPSTSPGWRTMTEMQCNETNPHGSICCPVNIHMQPVRNGTLTRANSYRARGPSVEVRRRPSGHPS